MKNPEEILNLVSNHILGRRKKLEGFIELTDQITHFKQIRVGKIPNFSFDYLNESINRIKNYQEPDQKALAIEFAADKITYDEFKKRAEQQRLELYCNITILHSNFHYYNPIILSQTKSISNVVKTESEIKFVLKFENYISKLKTNTKWAYCKLAENTDKIKIPYFDREKNQYRDFNPDFIFWFHSNDTYHIIFVDPKGITHSSYQNKVDDFIKYFYENGVPKVFSENNLSITVDLVLIGENIETVSAEYRRYWKAIDDFSWFNDYIFRFST
jgi:hypothetical protein